MVSAELDELTQDLNTHALDLLAEQAEMPVLLSMETISEGVIRFQFSDDEVIECIQAAHDKVLQNKNEVLRYAISYYAAVLDQSTDDEQVFLPAVITEFEERNLGAFSAFMLVEHLGDPEEFCWSDPAPAGELPSLL